MEKLDGILLKQGTVSFPRYRVTIARYRIISKVPDSAHSAFSLCLARYRLISKVQSKVYKVPYHFQGNLCLLQKTCNKKLSPEKSVLSNSLIFKPIEPQQTSQ
jgi:hypothetical protein